MRKRATPCRLPTSRCVQPFRHLSPMYFVTTRVTASGSQRVSGGMPEDELAAQGLLLLCGAPGGSETVDVTDNAAIAPAHLAAAQALPKALRVLLETAADANITDARGRTPLALLGRLQGLLARAEKVTSSYVVEGLRTEAAVCREALKDYGGEDQVASFHPSPPAAAISERHQAIFERFLAGAMRASLDRDMASASAPTSAATAATVASDATLPAVGPTLQTGTDKSSEDDSSSDAASLASKAYSTSTPQTPSRPPLHPSPPHQQISARRQSFQGFQSLGSPRCVAIHPCPAAFASCMSPALLLLCRAFESTASTRIPSGAQMVASARVSSHRGSEPLEPSTPPTAAPVARVRSDRIADWCVESHTCKSQSGCALECSKLPP